MERNLVIRQLRQKLKEEKARQIEQKIKNLEQLTSNPTKMYRAVQDIYKNKKPLLTLFSEKGLTTNEEKQQKLNNKTIKALTIMDFKQNTLNMHQNVYIKI